MVLTPSQKYFTDIIDVPDPQSIRDTYYWCFDSVLRTLKTTLSPILQALKYTGFSREEILGSRDCTIYLEFLDIIIHPFFVQPLCIQSQTSKHIDHIFHQIDVFVGCKNTSDYPLKNFYILVRIVRDLRNRGKSLFVLPRRWQGLYTYIATTW